ncbi:MAG: C39 family peptidase [Ruminococcus sp.]|nr:C39 family peptidase [Ruminococcus sp.]
MDDYSYYNEDNAMNDIEQARIRRKKADQLARDRLHAKMVLVGCALFIIILVICLVAHSNNDNNDSEKFVVANSDSSSTQEALNTDSSEALLYTSDDTTDEAEAVTFTKLYFVDNNTGYFTDDLSYPDGTLSGLFTGQVSSSQSGMIELDYNSDSVLINSSSALSVSNSVVLPISGVSQFLDSGDGGSGCGAAALTMLLDDTDNYSTLLSFAESNGYADQGSLNSYSGGMTYTSVAQLASDYYGVELVNVYNDSEAPSETLKKLIDDGHLAMVLVKVSSDAVISSSGVASHFIVVNGYIEENDELQFIYADSYNTNTGAVPLSHISSTTLDAAVSTTFDEPNTICYAE